MKELSIDLETYSDVDISKSGAYKYAESDNFEILLFGVSVDNEPVVVYDLTAGDEIPTEILAALSDDNVTKWAFNASFETGSESITPNISKHISQKVILYRIIWIQPHGNARLFGLPIWACHSHSKVLVLFLNFKTRK